MNQLWKPVGGRAGGPKKNRLELVNGNTVVRNVKRRLRIVRRREGRKYE